MNCRHFTTAHVLRLIGFALAALVWSGLVVGRPGVAIAADKAVVPPAAAHPVDFHREILPILANRCITCHARGRAEGGFSLETRTSTLGESDSGRAVLAGNSGESLLVQMVAGVDPDQVMPKQGRRLTSEEVGLLRAWIDQGVPWDADVSLRTLTLRAWKPRAVELPPAGPGLTHPIDRLLAPYAEKHALDLTTAVDDRTFARRLYYDLIGLPPTPDELQAFLTDPTSDKRDRLARTLLDDKSRYADHWLSFWNDLLRNDYEGTGYIDGGRQQITGWLYDALLTNKPLGQFVRDLIEPAPALKASSKGSCGGGRSTPASGRRSRRPRIWRRFSWGSISNVRRATTALSASGSCKMPMHWPACLPTNRWRSFAVTRQLAILPTPNS